MKLKIEITTISLIIILYSILEINLFDNTAVFSLLSPNETISPFHILYFLSFAILRLTIYLCLPPYLILRLIHAIINLKNTKLTGE